MSKKDWDKPAAWAVTQNERLWDKFDSMNDRSVIIRWSLGDTYRTEMMEPGDRAVFWITGRHGGLARVGFVLGVRPTPGDGWEDASGKFHPSEFEGSFFMPPFPNRRYIHRSVFADDPKMRGCELLGTAAQAPAPLRIEPAEWRVIERRLIQFDRTNALFRSPWS